MLYDDVETFIRGLFPSDEVKHLLRTVHWVKELRPGADESLMIAAVSHDIERAFRGKGYRRIDGSYKAIDHLAHHQEEGAKRIGDFLRKRGAEETTIRRVMRLVSRHEEGGDEDENLLKDADSLSFFENNVERFLGKAEGKGKIREKFDWMYERISSKKAKDIAREWYEDAIRRLG